MRLPVFLALGGMAAAAAVMGYAQTCPVDRIQPSIRNLDFAEGNPGERPPGWNPLEAACYLPPYDSYSVEVVAGRACYSGQRCAVVKSSLPVPGGEEEVIRYIHLLRGQRSQRLWFLNQVVDAVPYRGKVLTFRAAVRALVPSGSEARLLVRIHREDGSTSFFDNMGQFPVRSSAWHLYEIEAPIGREAGDVEFGLQLIGPGEAWIDHVSMEFAGGEK